MTWLPKGRKAAVCFSIDDVHPSTSADGYDAGGDLGSGALGRLERLLDRHSRLRASLFVTPDWKPSELVSNRLLARLPFVSERIYHVHQLPKGRFRVDRHPPFVDYLNSLPRTEIAPHGLHHIHRGPQLAVEFQEQTIGRCTELLDRALRIFDDSGLRYTKGFAPPGWNLPRALIEALDRLGFAYVASARDIQTEIVRGARNRMSGLNGASIVEPELIGDENLVHLPVNFQASSLEDRAEAIIANRGVLSIKAHIFKHAGGHTMMDGLDERYVEALDRLFRRLSKRHGDSLWWASMSEVAETFRLHAWKRRSEVA